MQENNAPSEFIKKSELDKKIKSVDLLECTPASILAVLVDAEDGSALVCIEVEGRRYMMDIESYEAAILSFTKLKCDSASHIRNVYKLLVDTNKEYGKILESATIEEIQGDVTYARLLWKDQKHRSSFCVSSLGSAMILHLLSQNSKLQIVRRLIPQLEPFDDTWNFEDEQESLH